ncbi:MAG: flagellar export chaperone FliS [Oscillospiraceae bacterium]|nr:flagellar export chaperone FliS [Oscillospiraceae bacterium]
MASTNPYEQYKKQSIMTMTQGELVVQLFEGCSKKLNAAVFYFENEKIEKAEEELYKAQRIVNYLNASLDRSVPISRELSNFYDFFIRMIVKAKVKSNGEVLKDVIPLIDTLGDSFREAEKIIHKK